MSKMLLPNKAWLKANGRGEMVKAMEADPEVFSHVPREPDLVSERAILARVNCKLAQSFEQGGVNRQSSSYHGGRFRHVNEHGAWLSDFDDLESFARQHGVMAANETIKN